MYVSVQSQKVAQYVLLPGLIPRIREAFSFSFAFLSFAFANCFDMARLLPPNHPYMNPANYGMFGILDVLRVAGANLKFSWRHIDQILIYFALLSAFVMFIVFLIVSVAVAVMTPAHAAMPTSVFGLILNIGSYFDTPKPDKDVALMLLDRVMGLKGDTKSGSFFGSNIPNMCLGGDLGGVGCIVPPFPSPYHIAMHAILKFYTYSIISFSGIILAYFIFILVMETTLTGVPMGSRFNRFWMPIRLVFALGLMFPLAPHGLNSAQYIVLYTAKLSSAFATNGWIYYNERIESVMGVGKSNPFGTAIDYKFDPLYGPTIDKSSPMAAKLNAPDMGDLVRFLHIVFACEYIHERKNPEKINIQGYFVRNSGGAAIPAYTEAVENKVPGKIETYVDAIKYFDYGNINIVFGIYDPVKYSDKPGGVMPLCGSLIIPVTSVNNPFTGEIDNPGAARINEYYYYYTMALIDKETLPRQLIDGFAIQMVERYAKLDAQSDTCTGDSDDDGFINSTYNKANLTMLGNCGGEPAADYIPRQVELYQAVFQQLVYDANSEISDPKYWAMKSSVLDRGWAGAGIWLNDIAKINGAFVSSVQQIPYGATLPVTMENIRLVAQSGIQNLLSYKDTFSIVTTQSNPGSGFSQEEAKAYQAIYTYLYGDDRRYAFRPDSQSNMAGVSGIKGYPVIQNNANNNPIIDAVNLVLGSQFLYNPRDNSDTHPLAQIVTFGRTLLERSARNLMTGSAIASMGGVMMLGNEDIGSSLKKTSSFFFAIASIFFGAGFMLFYILPILPFIYFFFSMLSWVKAIFEALIGAPLWAMAHLRLSGNGFPSSASVGGYYLLLEIFLRPIITVFGLVATMGIFTASVYVLNDMFAFVTTAATGGDFSDYASASGDTAMEFSKGTIDKLFFNILYIVLVYMFALSTFQLIDRIPNEFMKWFGGGLKSFSAESYRRDNPANTFINNSFVAVGYPVQGLISSAGHHLSSIAESSAQIADNATIGGGGRISQMIRNAVGPDRNTFVNETIEKLTSTHENHMLQAQHFEDLAKTTGDAAKAEGLLSKAAEARIKAEANDPALLLEELIHPGQSHMSASARSMATQNLETMKTVRSLTQDLLETGGTLRFGMGISRPGIQGPTGDSADPDTVQAALMRLIEMTKHNRR